jgi:hypothetical protein
MDFSRKDFLIKALGTGALIATNSLNNNLFANIALKSSTKPSSYKKGNSSSIYKWRQYNIFDPEPYLLSKEKTYINTCLDLMNDWAMHLDNKVQISTVSYSHRIENTKNFPGRLACGCYNEQSDLQNQIKSILAYKKIHTIDTLSLGDISGLGWDFHLGTFKVYWLIKKGDQNILAKKLGLEKLIEQKAHYHNFFIVSLTYKSSKLIEKKLYLYHKNTPTNLSKHLHPKALLSVTEMLSSTRGRIYQADVLANKSIIEGDHFSKSAQSVINLYAKQSIPLDTVSWHKKNAVTLYF